MAWTPVTFEVDFGKLLVYGSRDNHAVPVRLTNVSGIQLPSVTVELQLERDQQEWATKGRFTEPYTIRLDLSERGSRIREITLPLDSGCLCPGKRRAAVRIRLGVSVYPSVYSTDFDLRILNGDEEQKLRERFQGKRGRRLIAGGGDVSGADLGAFSDGELESGAKSVGVDFSSRTRHEEPSDIRRIISDILSVATEPVFREVQLYPVDIISVDVRVNELAAPGEDCAFVPCADRIARLIVGKGEFETQGFLIPRDYGAARSARLEPGKDHDELLVGAVEGVIRLDARSGALIARHNAAIMEVGRRGFNAACLFGDRLAATHSNLGLIVWQRRREGQRVEVEGLPVGGLRQLLRLSGKEALAVARSEILRIEIGVDSMVSARYRSPYPDLLLAVAVDQGDVFAGDTAGRVLRWHLDAPAKSCTIVDQFGGLGAWSLRTAARSDGATLIVATGSDIIRLLPIRGKSLMKHREIVTAGGCYAAAAGATHLFTLTGPIGAKKPTSLVIHSLADPSSDVRIVDLHELTGHHPLDLEVGVFRDGRVTRV